MKSLALAASTMLARRPQLPAARLAHTRWHQVHAATLPTRRRAANAWTLPSALPHQQRLNTLGSWLSGFGLRQQPLHTATPFAAGVAMGGTLATPSHYEVLNIPTSAPSDAVKKAYLKVSMECHPDRAASGTAEEQDLAHRRFLLVTQAFTVLSDPVKRQAYDSDLLRTAGGVHTTSNNFTYQAPAYTYPEYQVHYGQSPYKVFSNATVVFLLVVWMLIGITWHYLTLSTAKTELEAFLEERSRQAQMNHALARQRAKENGYKKQLELLRLKVTAD